MELMPETLVCDVHITHSVCNLRRCVTCRQLSEAQVLHGPRGHQWLLRVVQHVSQGVHPDVEVGDVDPHGLLPHSRLVGVPGRLKTEASR